MFVSFGRSEHLGREMFSFSRRRTPGWDKDVIQGTLQRTGPRRAQWPGPQQCLPPCSADQPLGFGSRSKEPQHRRRSRPPGLTESLTLPLRRSTTMCDFLLLFVGCKAPAATCVHRPVCSECETTSDKKHRVAADPRTMPRNFGFREMLSEGGCSFSDR